MPMSRLKAISRKEKRGLREALEDATFCWFGLLLGLLH
jgi:hypothetical protein